MKVCFAKKKKKGALTYRKCVDSGQLAAKHTSQLLWLTLSAPHEEI